MLLSDDPRAMPLRGACLECQELGRAIISIRAIQAVQGHPHYGSLDSVDTSRLRPE